MSFEKYQKRTILFESFEHLYHLNEELLSCTDKKKIPALMIKIGDCCREIRKLLTPEKYDN